MEDSIRLDAPIKTMQLYSHMDRIWNELKEEGIGENDKIPVAILNKFDCLNYGGAEGAARSVTSLCVDSSHTILDVGSGLGGPARCVHAVCGAKVIGIELQNELAELGNTLSAKCEVQDSVSITPGSITDESLSIGEEASFDAAMSWLVILHIPLESRSITFLRIHKLLKPGAKVYIEDFYRSGSGFSEREQMLLATEVYIPDSDLPTKQEYQDTVTAAGFAVEFEDVTKAWTEFTWNRKESWQAQKERHVRVHNEATWESLNRFYCAIAELFQLGSLGGARIVLTKL